MCDFCDLGDFGDMGCVCDLGGFCDLGGLGGEEWGGVGSSVLAFGRDTSGVSPKHPSCPVGFKNLRVWPEDFANANLSATNDVSAVQRLSL